MKKIIRSILFQILILVFLTTTIDFSVLSVKPVEAVKLRSGMASAKKITSTITIDGLLKEKSWEIKTPITQNVINTSNNKASFGMLWDSKYLYIGIKVTDSKLFTDSKDIKDDDCVQVFFDMNNNHFASYDIFDSFYSIGLDNKTVLEKYNKITGVRQVTKRTSTGYNVEMAFPWSTILVDKPKEGRILGFDVGICDDDNGNLMDSQLMWFGPAYNDIFASNFGEFYLNNTKNTLNPPKHPKMLESSVYHFKNYYEYVYPENESKIVRLWIPSVTTPVKGLIILGNGGDGDFRYESSHRELQLFAKKYGYGLVSHKGIWGHETYKENGAIILNALKVFAKIGKNPELVNAPFIYSGTSSGGASAYGMMNLVPNRVIGITSNVPYGFVPSPPVDAALKVPAMFTTGQYDDSFSEMRNVVMYARAKGALWSYLAVQGMWHEHRRTYHMFFPFWAKCIKLRVPADANPVKGPVKLNEIKEDSGWLADTSSWASGCTKIASYSEYTGEKSEASWIIDKDIAYLYRGLSTWNQRLNTTMVNNPVTNDDLEFSMKILKPGSEIILNVEPINFTGTLSKVEFYNGSELLGETTGTSIKFNLSNKNVSQTFTAVGYDEAGKAYASTIIGVIMDSN